MDIDACANIDKSNNNTLAWNESHHTLWDTQWVILTFLVAAEAFLSDFETTKHAEIKRDYSIRFRNTNCFRSQLKVNCEPNNYDISSSHPSIDWTIVFHFYFYVFAVSVCCVEAERTNWNDNKAHTLCWIRESSLCACFN